MRSLYRCTQFGQCDRAGTPQLLPSGGVPVCSACGSSMTAQSSQRSFVSRKAVLLAGLALLLIVTAAFSWKAFQSSGQTFRQPDLIGTWRAEETAVLGVSLPVGLQLEFSPSAATVMDTRLPVSAYEREKDLMHVVVTGTGGIDVTFTFQFVEPDRIIYQGPFGLNVKYRRLRGAP